MRRGEPPDAAPGAVTNARTARGRALDVGLAGYAAVCLLAITWPGFALAGAWADGLVLGLPFALAWNLGWVGLTFGVLVAYHRLR